MADASKKFQAPKGMRDFYPADLAARRHIENIWRQTSINHGFEEIDGPTFEHLDLYTHKSGPGIASELFQVFSGKDPEQVAAMKKDGAMAPYALRPEFTPTLARMVAARAPELPRPIKWFAIPSHFRAESPQRGRLREFMQWNVDYIGGGESHESVGVSDAEVISVAVSAMQRFGLTPSDVRVKLSHRLVVSDVLTRIGIAPALHAGAIELLDNRSRLSADAVSRELYRLGLSPSFFAQFEDATSVYYQLTSERGSFYEQIDRLDASAAFAATVIGLHEAGLSGWCEPDFGIVRGLAYYTGMVFEIHEASGAERAIAGGGRYDKLIENFGGPKLSACGFGMGDVVLANILKDKGLLKPAEEYLPRPDAFVIAASDDAAARLPSVVAELRRGGLHARQSYKTTRNVGKLLGDAGKCRARYAVILGAELAESTPQVALKNLDSGEQVTIPLAEIPTEIRRIEAPT